MLISRKVVDANVEGYEMLILAYVHNASIFFGMLRFTLQKQVYNKL
jgi:hypothetical protein